MKRSPALLLVIALYQKLNGLKRGSGNLSDIQVNDIICEMQNVTEMDDSQITSDEGLLEMGVQYALDKEAHEQFNKEQAADYRSVYA